MRDIWCGWQLA